MSNLKWLSLPELFTARADCTKYIGNLRNKLNQQEVRSTWIDHYIKQKQTERMTIQEIEKKLGHRVIIVASKNND